MIAMGVVKHAVRIEFWKVPTRTNFELRTENSKIAVFKEGTFLLSFAHPGCAFEIEVFALVLLPECGRVLFAKLFQFPRRLESTIGRRCGIPDYCTYV